MNFYVLDTNILLDYPNIVENSSNQLLISNGVLKELDGLKKSVNKEVAKNARRAAVYISRNMNNIDWDTEERIGTVDEQLLDIAQETGAILLTNDIYLKVQATILGIANEGYSQKDEYTGVEYLEIEADENRYNKILEDVLQTKQCPDNMELFENQYLIIKDTTSPIELKNGDIDYEVLSILKYKNKELKPIEIEPIKNEWINSIYPRNPEQKCLFDALLDRENTILYAGGSYGKG